MKKLQDDIAEKENLIEEMTLEKMELEETHAKEIDEVTETGMEEIAELEEKLDQEQEKCSTIEAELELLR